MLYFFLLLLLSFPFSLISLLSSFAEKFTENELLPIPFKDIGIFSFLPFSLLFSFPSLPSSLLLSLFLSLSSLFFGLIALAVYFILTERTDLTVSYENKTWIRIHVGIPKDTKKEPQNKYGASSKKIKIGGKRRFGFLLFKVFVTCMYNQNQENLLFQC